MGVLPEGQGRERGDGAEPARQGNAPAEKRGRWGGARLNASGPDRGGALGDRLRQQIVLHQAGPGIHWSPTLWLGLQLW
jgi:hypothetical protein